jgi:hypothetical protein
MALGAPAKAKINPVHQLRQFTPAVGPKVARKGKVAMLAIFA